MKKIATVQAIISVQLREHPEIRKGILVASDPGTGVAAVADIMFYVERKRIAELALARRLPAVFHNEEMVWSGGLMSYGASVTAIYRRAGAHIDKVIKGAKPGDLPVEFLSTAFSSTSRRPTRSARLCRRAGVHCHRATC